MVVGCSVSNGNKFLVVDMPSSGSDRYGRGRLSPNPLSMGMHSSLARDELLPPTREELGFLSGGHFDMPSSGLRGGILGGLTAGDREPSLLDQVMSERQRGGWRLDNDPLLMSRRHDEIPRQHDEIARQHDEILRRRDEETTEVGGKRVFLRNVRLCVYSVCMCTRSLTCYLVP